MRQWPTARVPHPRGPRPVIRTQTLPQSIGYQAGFSFEVDITNSQHLQSDFQVVLIRPGAVTHQFDFEQRYIELQINAVIPHPTISRRAMFSVSGPLTPSAAPPGWYMLFVLETDLYGNPSSKVPSVAGVVHVP